MTPEREKKSGVCIHGALRRQCETCDLAEQLEALEARCKALERVAHLADLLWREASKVERGDESYYETSPRLMELMADALAALSAAPPREAEGWETPREATLEDALEDMVDQFAYEGKDGELYTGGLSALEHAFQVLVDVGRCKWMPDGMRIEYLPSRRPLPAPPASKEPRK